MDSIYQTEEPPEVAGTGDTTAADRRWQAVLDRRGPLLVLAAVVAIALLPGLLRLESDNSPRVFFVEGSEAVARYEAFRQRFGSDRVVRLVVEGPGLFTHDGLRFLGGLEVSAAELEGVERVSGLAEHHRRLGLALGSGDWPPRHPEAFRLRAMEDDLDRAAGWITADGSAATVLLQLAPDDAMRSDAMSNAEALGRTLDDLENLFRDAPAGIEHRVLGLPVLNHALDRSSREIEERYFPLLVLFTLVLLLVFVRDPRELVAPLLFVGLCQLLTLAPMAYAGGRLNLVLAILPPLVFVIALATAVHVLLRVRQLAAEDTSADADDPAVRIRHVAHALGEKAWSVFWTGATTAIGFGSLALSPVGPVRSLGLWAGLGLVLSTVAAFLVLPPLLAVLAGGSAPAGAAARFEIGCQRLGRRWAVAAIRHRAGILVLAAIALGVAALGLPRVRVESNALRYLATDHPLRQGIEDLEARGVGVAALEILVERPDTGGGAPAAFVSAYEIDRLADLGQDLEKLDDVYGVLSAGAVLRDALRYVPITPGSAAFRPQMVLDGLERDDHGRQVLAALLSDDRRTARITAFVATGGVDALARLTGRIEAAAADRFPEARVQITGEYPLLLEAQGHLIETLVWSFGLTFLGIAIVLRLVLPSTRLALLALLPNLWPVAGVLGAMGWLGVPLDIATVMVASVVLGLAVDDTIHTLGHFRREAPVHGAEQAMVHTLETTAPAYILTGIILVAGFGVCALSDFAPIARFGGLSALAIALAVLGDLFLLPALLGLTPDAVVRRLSSSDGRSAE